MKRTVASLLEEQMVPEASQCRLSESYRVSIFSAVRVDWVMVAMEESKHSVDEFKPWPCHFLAV